MASSLAHLTQAQTNEGFYEDLGAERSNTPEWAMTVLFYAAVHYVQAACVHLRYQPEPSDHKERKKAIRTEFRGIASDYESLEDASRRARYECVKPARQELVDAKKQLREIAGQIAATAPPASYSP